MIKAHFRGEIARSQNLIFFNGVCLPASCSTVKVREFVNKRFLINADLISLGADCQSGDSVKFKTLDYFAM